MSPRFSISEGLLRSQSDTRLCALVRDGQPSAFAVIVERHQAALMRAAARVGGRQRAEDVVQEALLRAWASLRSGTRVEHVPSWLHTIVRNTALDQIARERGGVEELPDHFADPRTTGVMLDERLLVRELVAQIVALPERQRKALVDTELAGRSRREIAQDMGLTEDGVRQLVYRARSAIRVAMTAITPFPLAVWYARRAPAHGAVERLRVLLTSSGAARSTLAETLAAGSTAGGGIVTGGILSGGVLTKGGAVLAVVGALGGAAALHGLGTNPHASHPRASPVGGSRQHRPATAVSGQLEAGVLPKPLTSSAGRSPLQLLGSGAGGELDISAEPSEPGRELEVGTAGGERTSAADTATASEPRKDGATKLTGGDAAGGETASRSRPAGSLDAAAPTDATAQTDTTAQTETTAPTNTTAQTDTTTLSAPNSNGDTTSTAGSSTGTATGSADQPSQAGSTDTQSSSTGSGGDAPNSSSQTDN